MEWFPILALVALVVALGLVVLQFAKNGKK